MLFREPVPVEAGMIASGAPLGNHEFKLLNAIFVVGFKTKKAKPSQLRV
jgi:hypothetical protein